MESELTEALSWALDLLDMYDDRLIALGEPREKVYAPIHLKAKAKARAALKAALAGPQGEPEPAKQDAAVEAVSRVRTSFINPPIPIRAFDWVAWIDGEEESMRYGYGRTEQEARDELSNVLAEYDEENRK